MAYAKFKNDEGDLKTSDEFNRKKKEIVEAISRDDALEYFRLCNKHEICPERQDLYERGAAESDYQSRKKAEEESDIEAMVDEEASRIESQLEPVERRDFWKELYGLVKREINNKRNVRGSISCHPNGFVQGRGYVAHILYDILGGKYKDIFVDDEKDVSVREALDTALENLVHNSKPFPVKKTRSNGNIYYIQIGDFKEVKKDEAYEMFEREAYRATTVPEKRKVLEKYWYNYYTGENDLGKMSGLGVIKCFQARKNQLKRRKRKN